MKKNLAKYNSFEDTDFGWRFFANRVVECENRTSVGTACRVAVKNAIVKK